MTRGFAAGGHRVAGCARSAQAVAELNREFGPESFFEVVDVADDSGVELWAKKVLARVGPPDLLVNNAAIINQSAPLWEVGAEEFDRVIDINIKGTANVIRHFLPAMIKAGRGVVVNFSSGWGRSTAAEVAPYCATKWAIEGLTQALAQELPPGLAAIPLNPGIIQTEMLQSCFGESAGQFPTPENWAARAVPFLLKLGAKDNGKPLSVA